MNSSTFTAKEVVAKKGEKKHRTDFTNKSNKPDHTDDWTYPARLNKYIAKCGICSRRAAADLVKEGRATVNGNITLEPFTLIEENDKVEVDGKLIKPQSKLLYILLNKPKNTITTTKDERGRPTVMDIIDIDPKWRLFPVGRLDRHTVGLLLITNDGNLAKKLSHPSHEITKKYRVSLDKPLSEAHEASIRRGLTLEDGPVSVDELHLPKPDNRKKIELSIHVGRNRIVRRIFEHLGYTVTYLERYYFAGLTAKGLPLGKHRYLHAREVIMLKHFV